MLFIAELVTKRFLEGWKANELSERFGRSQKRVKTIYLEQKKLGFTHPSISPEVRAKLLEATSPQ